MATLKRSATVMDETGSPLKMPRLLREPAMLSPLPVHRVGALQPFIVVVQHCYPIESASNDFGQARGLGNTFTMEVVAADDQDAIATVEAMFQIDFEASHTMTVMSAAPAPGVDYSTATGRTVSVLSSRHCAVREGHGPYEELFNAVRDEKVIAGRGAAVVPETDLETQVHEHMIKFGRDCEAFSSL